MKTQMKIVIATAATLCISLCGCAGFLSGTSQPSATERMFFDVQTNLAAIPQQVKVTNTVVEVVTLTNIQNQVVTETNIIPQVVITTNVVETPIYTLTPKASVTSDIQAGGSAVNTLYPGVGSMVSMGLLAILGAWGHYRGIKYAPSAEATASLSQEIETMREFIMTLPQGAKYDQAITSWLQSHQMDTGVATTVLDAVENQVSNADAKAAVAEIVNTIKVASGTPVV